MMYLTILRTPPSSSTRGDVFPRVAGRDGRETSRPPRRAVTAAPERRNARFALVPSVVATMPPVANPTSRLVIRSIKGGSHVTPVQPPTTSGRAALGSKTQLACVPPPVSTTLAPVRPVRLLATGRKEEMPRNQTVASELVDLVEDVKAGIHKLAILDGVICEQESRLMQIADEALWKALDNQNGIIVAKNAIDNGGLVPSNIRRDREHKRDIAILKADANVVYLEDYRRNGIA